MGKAATIILANVSPLVPSQQTTDSDKITDNTREPFFPRTFLDITVVVMPNLKAISPMAIQMNTR